MDNLDKIKEWVKQNYHQYSTGWTAERSCDNCEDCFSDGYECGQSLAAYEVGIMLGMDLANPDKPEYN